MKITATSQLMPNHVAGAPLAAQKQVAVAYTADRSPMLFSLDQALALAVTLPSAGSATGWEQIDIGAQLAGVGGLGAVPRVQAFAVSQDADGTIWLMVAAAPAATAPSTVFISRGLSNGTAAAEWKSLRPHLAARQIPAGLVVSRAVVGSSGGAYPLAVVVADDTSNPVLQDRTRKSPEQSQSNESPAGNWGTQQLSANAGGSSPAASVLPAVDDLWLTLGQEEVKVLQQAYASLQDRLVNHYQDYTYAELIEMFLEIVATAVVDAAENALLTIMDAAALMAGVVKALLTARWDIPVLTYVYAQITAVAGARTWDQLIQGLATAPAQGRGSGQLTTADPALMAAAIMEFIGMFARGMSALFFGLRELTDFAAPVKRIFNIGKIAADYLTYSMSMVSIFVMNQGTSQASMRKSIDVTMTMCSVAGPARDSYLLWYREEQPDDQLFNAMADALRIIETPCGIIFAVCSIVSLGLQAAEPAPPGIDINVWRSIVAMKFRLKGATARVIILAVRWVANCVRASQQVHYRIADYDGPL